MKLKQYMDDYKIPMVIKNKTKKINPKTNREKTFKTIKYLETNIDPKDRSFKNLPKYADGKSKVRFQDWLLIKGQGGGSKNGHITPNWYGKSKCDGKYYGWSHRAVYGFGVGDVVTPKTSGFSDLEKEFTIKTDNQAKEVAMKFGKSVS